MIELKIEGDLSIRSITTQYERVRSAFDSSDSIVLNCIDVDRVDVTGIQLLISATKTAEDEHRYFRLVNASLHLNQALSRAGLELVRSADGLQLK